MVEKRIHDLEVAVDAMRTQGAYEVQAIGLEARAALEEAHLAQGQQNVAAEMRIQALSQETRTAHQESNLAEVQGQALRDELAEAYNRTM